MSGDADRRISARGRASPSVRTYTSLAPSDRCHSPARNPAMNSGSDEMNVAPSIAG